MKDNYNFALLQEEFTLTATDLLGDVYAIESLLNQKEKSTFYTDEMIDVYIIRLGDYLNQHTQDLALLGQRLIACYLEGQNT